MVFGGTSYIYLFIDGGIFVIKCCRFQFCCFVPTGAYTLRCILKRFYFKHCKIGNFRMTANCFVESRPVIHCFCNGQNNPTKLISPVIYFVRSTISAQHCCVTFIFLTRVFGFSFDLRALFVYDFPPELAIDFTRFVARLWDIITQVRHCFKPWCFFVFCSAATVRLVAAYTPLCVERTHIQSNVCPCSAALVLVCTVVLLCDVTLVAFYYGAKPQKQ